MDIKKKPLRFKDLTETAKQEAAEKVMEKESCGEYDWSIESDMLTEALEEHIKGTGLNYGSIGWDTRYRYTVDLTSVEMTDKFIKKHLPKEKWELYQELQELTSEYITHHTFEGNYDNNYELEFDYGQFDDQEGMTFLLNHSEDDEAKNKFKLLHLLEEELDDEEQEELQSYLIELGENICKEISEIICEKVDEIENKMQKMVEDTWEYYYSSQNYYDQLESEGCYLEEKYQFSEKGDIVMIDDEIVDEYEDDYIDGSEEDDENDLNEESKHFKENNKTASVEVVHEWQNHIQQ